MRAPPITVVAPPDAAPAEWTAKPRCSGCRHRQSDRWAIEQQIPGLAVFGSAYGASIGASRLCAVHDRLVSPHDRCARFAPAQHVDE
jgi:hypothetical protein